MLSEPWSLSKWSYRGSVTKAYTYKGIVLKHITEDAISV